MANKSTPTLDDRITALQAELKQFIDDRAETIKKTTPGVPVAAIRNMLTHGLCPCGAYREIREKDDAEAQDTAA